jgi:hypothetical protein
MKLYNYLNEVYGKYDTPKDKEYIKDSNFVIDYLTTDCKYYVSLLRKNDIKEPFYRGVHNYKQDTIIDTILYKKLVRKDRKPFGMLDDEAKRLNTWLIDHGHTDRSKSVMASSDQDAVDLFGTPLCFWPIGKFNYTYCKTGDLNEPNNISRDIHWALNYLFMKLTLNDKKEDLEKEWIDKANTYLEDFFVTNGGIHKAYNGKYEIWFDCDSYYLTTPHMSGRIIEEVLK